MLIIKISFTGFWMFYKNQRFCLFGLTIATFDPPPLHAGYNSARVYEISVNFIVQSDWLSDNEYFNICELLWPTGRQMNHPSVSADWLVTDLCGKMWSVSHRHGNAFQEIAEAGAQFEKHCLTTWAVHAVSFSTAAICTTILVEGQYAKYDT